MTAIAEIKQFPEPKPLNIYQKLVEVRKTVQYLQKDKKSFNYQYVAGSSVIGSLRAKMDEHNLLLFPNILEKKTYGSTETVWDKKTNQYREKPIWVVEADMNMVWLNADNPDEKLEVPFYCCGAQDDISKAFGSALTYTERYFLLKFFNIATDKDDPDFYQRKQDRKQRDNVTPLPQNPPPNQGGHHHPPVAPQNQFQPISQQTHGQLEGRINFLANQYGVETADFRTRIKSWCCDFWKIPASQFHFNTHLNMPMFQELWDKLEGFAKKFSSEIQEKKYSRPAETWNDKPRADKSHGDTMQCESCADDKTGFCPRCELINSYPINNENVIKTPLELPEDEKTLLFDQSVKKTAIACSGACGRVWVQGLSRGSKIQNGSQVIPWKMTGGGISDKPEQFFCFDCWQKIQEQKEQYKQ